MWQGRNDSSMNFFGSGGSSSGNYMGQNDRYSGERSSSLLGQGGGGERSDMISTSKLLGTISQLAHSGGVNNNKLAGAIDLINTALSESTPKSTSYSSMGRSSGYNAGYSSALWNEGRVGGHHHSHHVSQQGNLRGYYRDQMVPMRTRRYGGPTTVWVGNILASVPTKTIIQLFTEYGKVSNYRRLKDKFCAFIDYPNLSCADNAIRELNGHNLMGRSLIVKIKDGSSSSSGNSNSNSNNNNNSNSSSVNSSKKRRAYPPTKDEVVRYKSQKCIDNLPNTLLGCHMCKIFQFKSQDDFLQHMNSQQHSSISKIFYDKNYFILKMLRYNSRMTILKEKLKSKESRRGEMCDVCNCEMLFIPDKSRHKSKIIHENTVEHKLVDHFMNKKCCGIKFNNRRNFEEHKLTFQHMKMQIDKKDSSSKEGEVKEGENIAQKMPWMTNEEVDGFFNELDTNECLFTKPEDELTYDSLPEYDPDKPIGMNHINWYMITNCQICSSKSKLKIRSSAKSFHCRSVDHYLEVVKQQQMEKSLQEPMNSEETSYKEVGEALSDSDEETTYKEVGEALSESDDENKKTVKKRSIVNVKKVAEEENEVKPIKEVEKVDEEKKTDDTVCPKEEPQDDNVDLEKPVEKIEMKLTPTIKKEEVKEEIVSDKDDILVKKEEEIKEENQSAEVIVPEEELKEESEELEEIEEKTENNSDDAEEEEEEVLSPPTKRRRGSRGRKPVGGVRKSARKSRG